MDLSLVAAASQVTAELQGIKYAIQFVGLVLLLILIFKDCSGE